MVYAYLIFAVGRRNPYLAVFNFHGIAGKPNRFIFVKRARIYRFVISLTVTVLPLFWEKARTDDIKAKSKTDRIIIKSPFFSIFSTCVHRIFSYLILTYLYKKRKLLYNNFYE